MFVISMLKSLEYPAHLRINQRKTRHFSKKGRVAITGLIVTPDGKVSIGRKTKRRIRALVHQWDTLEPTERSNLAGFLAYCASVEPTFLNALYQKYGKARMEEIKSFPMSSGEKKFSLPLGWHKF
jgi:RNA-directed DNA polymerase